MAEPTTVFRVIPQTTATTAVDTAAERLAAISGQSIVSTGDGNEVDFGTIDTSSGAANSTVKTILWGVTADGGNTVCEDFRFYAIQIDFGQAASVLKLRALSGADKGSPSLTQNYVANGVVASYTWVDLPESLPASQNLYPSDEGTGMALSTTSDDVIMFALYVAVAANESTGTYKGTTSGRGLQFGFRYSYS